MTSSDQNQEDFASLLQEYEQTGAGSPESSLPEVGETVHGKIVTIGNDSVFVTLGAKAEAVLARDQVLDRDGNLTVAVGDTIEARVVEIRDGQVILRTSLGRGPEAKNELAQAHEHGIPVEGLVSNVIKGGVEVQVAGVRAFCPMSQLDNRFVEDASVFIGEKLEFRIIRYETGRGPNANIVLSRRVLLEEKAAEQAVETRERLEVGAVMKGRITSIKPYGAFVDLGGVEGMLHISELGFARVEHPSEAVSVDQEVEVQVIKIESTGNAKRPEKIALSLKALAKDPWDVAAAEFPEGSRVSGRVMRTQPFGAFVELMPGVDGLVHISQMGANRRISHARDVVSIGDRVDVVVLGFDRSRRRISLSMADAARHEEQQEVEEYRKASKPGKRGGSRRGDRREGGRGRDGSSHRDGDDRRDGGDRRESSDYRDSGRGRENGAGFGTLGDLLKYKKR